MSTIGENIKRIRTERGYTQDDLAQMTTFSRIESIGGLVTCAKRW